MPADPTQPAVFADDKGIHLPAVQRHIVIEWGEIREINALRNKFDDGTEWIEVSIVHFSTVDFPLHSTQAGFDQVLAAMEKHLIGFKRAAVDAARSFEEEGWTIPVIWERDETIQPFRLRKLENEPREPTDEERTLMEAARRASIETCEKILGRPLQPQEIACVRTEFKNGRIVGNIEPPLCHLLLKGPAGE